MATHDYVIDNQTAPNFRADLNNALLAIVSNNSSATAPAVTYANMMWCDTAANILYIRNEGNDAWIRLGTLDQTADTFSASVALASQAEAEAGTNNTKVMTPLRVKQLIDANVDFNEGVAAIALGDIGSIAMLFEATSNTTAITVGSTRSGADLRYNGAYWQGALGQSWQASAAGGAPAGIWQLLGLNTQTASVRRGGVWKRIS